MTAGCARPSQIATRKILATPDLPLSALYWQIRRALLLL